MEYVGGGAPKAAPAATRAPERVKLVAVQPNPFVNTTVLRFRIPKTNQGMVATIVNIYDVNGKLVKALVNGDKPAGRMCEVEWKGYDQDGKKMDSGVYYYEFIAGEKKEAGSLMLMK